VNREQMQLTEIQAPPNFYQGFMYFSLAVLAPDSQAPCSIRLEAYNQNLGRLRLVETLQPGDTIRAAWLDILLDEGVCQAYIALEDLSALQAYLHQQTKLLLSADQARAHLLVYENALCAIKSALLDPKNGRRLAMAAATVRGMIQHIWETDSARQGMLKVMTLSQELYTHSLNVCLLGVGLASALGWRRDQVDSLGVALFFHDLGLAENAGEQNVPLPLSLQNEEALSPHAEASACGMALLPEVDDEAVEMVRCHHENLDGSGSPRGLSSSQLSAAARLARIVDVYERATSGCLTSEVLSAFAALQMMRHEMREQLDQETLSAFVRLLGQA